MSPSTFLQLREKQGQCLGNLTAYFARNKHIPTMKVKKVQLALKSTTRKDMMLKMMVTLTVHIMETHHLLKDD
jgi:hypothetical protein